MWAASDHAGSRGPSAAAPPLTACATRRRGMRSTDVVRPPPRRLWTGLYGNPYAYLRDNWNLIDVTVVAISWVSIVLSAAGSSSGGIRALRAMRVLRPMRLVHRIPSMRIVVHSIFMAIPGVTNVAALLGFFLMVFAILGVQFFGGKLGRCEIAAITNRTGCEATVALLLDGRTQTYVNRSAIWYNPDIGDFDNVLGAVTPRENLSSRETETAETAR